MSSLETGSWDQFGYFFHIFPTESVCVCVCVVCAESIQPCNMKNRIFIEVLKKIQDIKNIVHRTMTP